MVDTPWGVEFDFLLCLGSWLQCVPKSQQLVHLSCFAGLNRLSALFGDTDHVFSLSDIA